MSIYTPILCSCLVCKKQYSNKGIHTHFKIAHTKEGRQKHTVNANYMHKMTISTFSKRKVDKNIALYNNSPKYCKQCSNKIQYKKRHNTFCGRSCSATHTNNNRTEEQQAHQTAKIKQYCKDNPKQHLPPKSSVTPQECKWCSTKIFYNKLNPLSYSINHCSKKCCSSTRSYKARLNPNLGNRRSKDEIKLFNLIQTHYTNVTSNEKLYDGWDMDILMHTHRIAIMWNGPWHYKEMNFGNHSLKQVQNRDKIKTKLYEENGWVVVVYEDKHFTPELAFTHLRNIT